MRIEVKDLPPKLQEQVWRKVIKQDQQRKREPLPSPSLAEGQKASKYHNRHTERVAPSGTVIRFDSQREARRYDNLMAWQKTGEMTCGFKWTLPSRKPIRIPRAAGCEPFGIGRTSLTCGD